MAPDETSAGKSDHLKMYCIVFGFLVLVIGFVALQQRSSLAAYKRANSQAAAMLTATGRTSDGRPRAIGDLALEVEKFVQGYKQSSGAGDEGISTERMVKAEVAVHMTHTYAGPVQDDRNNTKGYRTTARNFTYGPCTLEQLTKLVWNIESWGRYRVYEITWGLADKKANSAPPHNMVNKPQMKVGYRTAITRER